MTIPINSLSFNCFSIIPLLLITLTSSSLSNKHDGKEEREDAGVGGLKFPANATGLASKLCVTSSFERCLSVIKEITEKPELAFASTSQDLTKACRKLQQGVKCADDHMTRCSSHDERVIFEEVVKGSRRVIQMLCRPGKLQSNYLKFAPCLKNMATLEDECYFWVKTVQNMSTKFETENTEENLKKFCCSFSRSVDCQVNSVRRLCGEDAIQFFQQHLEQMSTALIDQHCSSYTYLPESCALQNGYTSHGSSNHQFAHHQSFHHGISITIISFLSGAFQLLFHLLYSDLLCQVESLSIYSL